VTLCSGESPPNPTVKVEVMGLHFIVPGKAKIRKTWERERLTWLR
jgi:hypothetical protein